MASLTIRKLDDDAEEAPAPARRAERPLDGGRGAHHPAARRRRRGRQRRGPGRQAPRFRRSASEQAEPSPGDAPGPGAKRVLLIIGGGIAAYKSLDLIRRLRERGAAVRCVLTDGGAGVRHAAVGRRARGRAASSPTCSTPQSEFDVGHIRLARDTDLVVVAPATADLMAKMAGGHADDLATAVLLATDKPVLIAPAMNPHMWAHPATQRNLAQLARRRRRASSARTPARWRSAARPASAAWPSRWRSSRRPRRCSRRRRRPGRSPARRMLVTSGPTHEPIDPVRYIANRSSGKQGHAIARGGRRGRRRGDAGVRARCNLPDPPGVKIDPGRDARARCWRPSKRRCRPTSRCSPPRSPTGASPTPAAQKIKKQTGGAPPLALVENPDILATVAQPQVRAGRRWSSASPPRPST